MSKKSIIIVILILIFLGLFIAYLFSTEKISVTSSQDQNVLVLMVDPTEKRPGMGAVDMAFIVKLKNGSVSSLKPIYPGEMTHPTASPPPDLEKTGLKKLYLHDALWDIDTNKGAKLAQEIVKYNTGIKTDAVVIIKPETVDAILTSIGPVYIEGEGTVSGNSLIFLRNMEKNGVDRGKTVESLAYAIKNASKDDSKRSAIFNTINVEYARGNIVVIPNDFFLQFIASEGLNKLFG